MEEIFEFHLNNILLKINIYLIITLISVFKTVFKASNGKSLSLQNTIKDYNKLKNTSCILLESKLNLNQKFKRLYKLFLANIHPISNFLFLKL